MTKNKLPMKRIITLCLLALGITAQAQEFEWVKTIDLQADINSDMINYTTACDPQGNIYFAGIEENVSFNCVDLMGSLTYNKYSSDGTLIYAKKFDGYGAIFSMKPDSQGNMVLAIGYTSSLTIGNTTLTADEFTPNFSLIKLNSEGNLLWHSQMILPDAEAWDFVSNFKTISLDENNNIYVGYDNFFHSYIVKFSSLGEQQLIIPQLFTSRVTSVSVDKTGNIYVAGSCPSLQSVFAGVPAPIADATFYSIYLVKYNAAGEYQWVKFVEDITCPDPQVAASGEHIYFSSTLGGPVLFDDIQTQGPTNFWGDFFLAKLNASGEYLWVAEVPQTGGEVNIGRNNFLNVDQEGNAYIVGRTRMTIDWSENITTNIEGFNSEAIVLKYNTAGEVIMAKTAGGISSEDKFDGIITNSHGDIFLTGVVTGGTINFDEIEYEYDSWEIVPFLTKLGHGMLSTETPAINAVSLYPNPASKELYITNLSDDSKGEIFNTLGQKVMDFTITDNTPIIVDRLSPGTYIIKTEDYKTFKFIKQ